MRSLLDINVLIALLDPEHSLHAKAHRFWKDPNARVWASCPIVENGVVRVLTGAAYPGVSAYSSTRVFELLRVLIDVSDHEFWADDISLLDTSRFHSERILGPKQLTDIYMLGLSASRGGRLVTFDRKITTAALLGASENQLLVLE